MKVYVQTDKENRVTDVITYPVDGYVEIEATLPLPPSVIGGTYELFGGTFVYRDDWDTTAKISTLEEQISALREEVDALKA
jgi:hypothetical protein